MVAPIIIQPESPPGLKPNSSGGLCGAAEAAPLQGNSSGNLNSSEDLNSSGNLNSSENLNGSENLTSPGNPIARWNSWVLAPIALIAAVLAVPYFLTHGFWPIAFALQRAFALVCHQRPERSFWIFGSPVAVCARCLGIYLGAAIGLLFRTPRRLALQFLSIAAALNLLDVATEFAGLHGNWMTLRFALGIALGAAGGLLISSAIISAVVDSRVPDC